MTVSPGPAASSHPAQPSRSGHPPASTGDALLRAATRHSGVRCVALGLLALAATTANLLLPAALGRALDTLLTDPSGATRRVLSCTALILVLAVLDAFETVLGATTNARATAWLRERLTGHVLDAGPRAGRRFGPGELVARLVGSAGQAGAAPAALAGVLAALATPLGAIVALWLIDYRPALVFLCGAPVIAVLLKRFTRDSSQCVARYQDAQGRIAGSLTEAIDGARTVAAAGTADKEVARILRPLPELSREGHRMWRVQGRAAAQAVAVAPLLQIAVLATAGLLLTRHALSVGELLAASRYAVLASGVGVLVGRLGGLIEARASAHRLGELLDVPATAHGTRHLPRGRGHLELRDVTVRRGGRTVLGGVDLVVPGGTTLAVVGRSGTGKSLLAALAGRLADPDGGDVLLDGVPLRALDRRELRREIGYAFERPALLGDSVEATIGFGHPTPPAHRIRAAARTARADDFVRRLPHGYATPCAGAPLSGGEVQRLGLARAFARGGRLLILDDALSSLDTVTERHVSEALFGNMPGRSRLIVAHRASTAARADTVAWLDEGRVRAVGRHDELWTSSAEYRRVFGSGADAAEGLDEGPAGGADDGSDDGSDPSGRERAGDSR
ncbi:ATP-binding cassette subfamily B protein [Streptomyces aurantiacus]|uniref:ABC transporter ATP-binding protein n=1 Tax=Streptomyces aurantiacus TaxID=47760 RepID=UPI0027914831|nr:ABC transporter ATP-binding protein [Streptomyces aurantiacus]MDQ0772520.1 ATP-binding cassette subfamily B protein [Streptomyces aurantiacus]